MIRFMLRVCAFVFIATSALANSLPIEIVDVPGQRWDFSHVSARQGKEGWVVSGRLNDWLGSGLPTGHVDMVALGPDGTVLAKNSATYVPSMLTREARKQGGVRFSAVLPQTLPADARIQVSFHRDAPESSRKQPVHSDNTPR